MNSEANTNLSFQLGHDLHRASQLADDIFAVAAANIDLTARQLTVLEIIAQVDRPSQTDICMRSGIDRSTVADMVLRLVRKRLVERRRSRTDARRYALQLTEAGRAILEIARPIARDVDARLAADLPSGNTGQFVLDLKCIANKSRG